MDRGRQRSISIGLVVVHESAAAVLYSLHEVFSFVGQSWEEMTGRPAGPVRLIPRLVAERRGLTTSRLGVPVSPDAAFADAGVFDVVIAPDLALEPGVDPRGQWPAAAAWLREQYAQGAIVCSVCTGSVLLAEAGLLDGLEATSHWGAVPLFERFYPRVRLESARVLVPAGAEHRIITSGGYSSWAELALYLVARFCGQEEAIRTAKVFVLGDRSEGQLPFAAMVRPRPYDDAAVARSFALRVPVYAISLVNQPHQSAAMADLEGVRFIDVPWLVTPDVPTLAKLPRRDTGNVLLDRLYALGLDAFQVARAFVRGVPERLEIAGATGQLTLAEGRHFARDGVLAEFRRGQVVPADAPR